jgi:putative DNA primase/helicase
MHDLNTEITPHYAAKFLNLIAGKPGERFMFRVIAERPDLKGELASLQKKENEKAKLENRKSDDLLAVTKAGTLAELWGWLVERNAQGWAVYVVINETTGNDDKDVVRVRAHFADFDEIFMNEDQCNERRKRLRRFNELAPTSMAVSSSPNKIHTYWLTRGAPLKNFKPFQRRIAEFFGNDPVISNLSRIMRVPGFLYQKNGPHLTKITWTGNPEPIEASCLKTALGQCLKELGPWPYAAKPHDLTVNVLGTKEPLRDAKAERVRSALLALLAIPAGDRDIRLKVGAALHSTGWGELARQIWDEWCRTLPEKFDEAEQEKAWRSFSIAANCEARRARRLSPYRRHEVQRDDMIKYVFYK